MSETPKNPKQEGSNVCDAIPQVGPCIQGCNQCFYNRPNAFYTNISETLMPTLEEVGDKIVRVNSGNDSNYKRNYVIATTNHYLKKFFNTSIPELDFPDPVVFTANPKEEEWFYSPKDIRSGSINNLMFIRLRVSSSNLELIDSAIEEWTQGEFKIPIVLTFMRYYDEEPKNNNGQFEFKKHVLNSYWCPTKVFVKKVLKRYKNNELVTMCGTLKSPYCRDCGNCEKYYLEAKNKGSEKKNRLTAIGTVGSYIVYLNVEPREALKRFHEEYPGSGFTERHIRTFEFDDKFQAYEVGYLDTKERDNK